MFQIFKSLSKSVVRIIYHQVIIKTQKANTSVYLFPVRFSKMNIRTNFKTQQDDVKMFKRNIKNNCLTEPKEDRRFFSIR